MSTYSRANTREKIFDNTGETRYENDISYYNDESSSMLVGGTVRAASTINSNTPTHIRFVENDNEMELSPIRDSISGLLAAGQSPFSQNVISGGAKSANLQTRINSTANPPVSLETEENQTMEDVDRTRSCDHLPVLARTGGTAAFSSSSELRTGRNNSTNSSSLTSSRATAGITATIAGSTTTNLSTVLISSGRDQIVEKNVCLLYTSDAADD